MPNPQIRRCRTHNEGRGILRDHRLRDAVRRGLATTVRCAVPAARQAPATPAGLLPQPCANALAHTETRSKEPSACAFSLPNLLASAGSLSIPVTCPHAHARVEKPSSAGSLSIPVTCPHAHARVEKPSSAGSLSIPVTCPHAHARVKKPSSTGSRTPAGAIPNPGADCQVNASTASQAVAASTATKILAASAWEGAHAAADGGTCVIHWRPESRAEPVAHTVPATALAPIATAAAATIFAAAASPTPTASAAAFAAAAAAAAATIAAPTTSLPQCVLRSHDPASS